MLLICLHTLSLLQICSLASSEPIPSPKIYLIQTEDLVNVNTPNNPNTDYIDIKDISTVEEYKRQLIFNLYCGPFCGNNKGKENENNKNTPEALETKTKETEEEVTTEALEIERTATEEEVMTTKALETETKATEEEVSQDDNETKSNDEVVWGDQHFKYDSQLDEWISVTKDDEETRSNDEVVWGDQHFKYDLQLDEWISVALKDDKETKLNVNNSVKEDKDSINLEATNRPSAPDPVKMALSMEKMVDLALNDHDSWESIESKF